MIASSDSLLGYALAALRANDGLIVGIALCIGIPLVLTVIGLIMRAAGALPRKHGHEP